ncbi:MAG: hypothetical protein ACT4N2_11800 [Hyphomicrobium sp.]
MPQFPATIDLGALTGSDGATPGFRIDGVAAGDFSGTFVASAGDINGDGFDDMIIGAPYASPGGLTRAGASYVVFGQSAGFCTSFDLGALDGSNGFRLTGAAGNDLSGISVNSAGDVNGDGFDDIIIGAPQYSPPLGIRGSATGESYVVFGREAGFTPTVDLSTLNGSNGFRLEGIYASSQAGYAVASAGDVNGDGFDDVIIGARAALTAGAPYAGESYVVFGHAGGFDASLDLATLDGANGFRLVGVDSREFSGFSVASAGDVNGDGFDDVIVGVESGYPGGQIQAGESYVVFGRASGFSPSLDLATLDGSNGFRVDGTDFLDQSGRSVASAGDVNADGFDDLIIGAPTGSEASVVFGRANGFDATFQISSLDGSNGFTLDSLTSDRTGWSVASAGDMNGDGFDDVVIGAIGGSPGGDGFAGQSFVVFGGASGFSATLDLAALDGSNGFRLDGIDADDYSGRCVASAGDLNNDGLSDLIIGANLGDPGGRSNAGETYVIFGRMPDAAVIRSGTDASQSLVGGDYDDTLFALGGGDELWGHVGRDRLYGGRGDDVLRGGAGNDRLAGGAGNDGLNGGDGNDTYFVDSAGDTVTELASEGTDRVNSSVSHTLADFVEYLFLGGSGAIDGTGNALANRIIGNAGDNTLNGREGNDVLKGSAGADAFQFDTALNTTTNRDRITDFSHAVDVIRLDDAIFTAIGPLGQIDADAFFVVGSGPRDADDRIIYNADTGRLQYDADGSGAGAAVTFAVLTGSPNDVTFEDFFVV